MRLNPFILFLLTVAVSVSCSTTEQKADTTVQYSEQTEKTFNSIETEEAQLLERYRQMRMKNWDRYINKKNRPNAAADYARTRQQENSKTERQVKVAKTPPPQPELSDEQLKAIEIEIAQRMSIFCMKAKTVNRFDSEADCQAYVENNHYECMRQFGDRNKALVGCMKGRLK